MLNAVAACICFIIGGIFLKKGIKTIKRKSPAVFLYNSGIKPENITDVVEFNTSSGKMWICYSKLYFLAGLLSIFSAKIGTTLLLASFTLGTIFLLIYAQYLLFIFKSKESVLDDIGNDNIKKKKIIKHIERINKLN